jgi:hypothetical protein
MNKTFSTSLVVLFFACLICHDTGVGTRQQAVPAFLSPSVILQTVRLAQNTPLAVAAKKAVEQRFIPKKPAAKSRKFKKQSFWKRLKFWKKKKTKDKRLRNLEPGFGRWLLSFLVVLIVGFFMLYLNVGLVVLLTFAGLDTLSILTFVLGLFGIYLLLRKLWLKLMGTENGGDNATLTHAEDIQGKANQPTEPEGADIPRYQYLELDNSEITLCIYNTQSGNTPVRVRMGDKELTSHFGVANAPKCFDLSISENAKNEIHFEAPDQAMGKKELLRIVVEDGDIAREIYVRKGGILELRN